MQCVLFMIILWMNISRKVDDNMIFCRNCGSIMSEILSFSKDKRERYNKCNKCRNEKLKNKLTDKELDERYGKDGINTYVKKISKY